ncbi:CheR family methyltransferase [Qipengyuania spongiae]|uniref:Protein-glutamate O-methyltransferase CheR n=1 Tax=Qipengyuania spongiae TaxID=2909673 RepID=A0ABY5T4P8_9SPHN|nr:protein-glutamate O-methyltransferase CheR [Qipengyuania spongiae]UVI40296.1 protein-glutamate O-methyltransferase CheR [Qipengyuania spongiae]
MRLSDAPIRVIADLLAARTGQELTESRLWRVPSALSCVFRERGISNVDQLVCLMADGGDPLLADEVVEALINNETYFFRDHLSFQTLAERILPDLAQKRAGSRRLSIWSAGCSTGQEALSLAMLFRAQPQAWDGWTIDIVATDVSKSVIETARKGHYSQFEIQRGITIAQMLEFFSETGDGWQANDDILSMLRHQQRSLLDAPPAPGRFDLVLCRNVLLYFDRCTRARAFDRLSAAVRSDGWLMLGAGETVVGQTEKFDPGLHGCSLCVPRQPAIAPAMPMPRAAIG